MIALGCDHGGYDLKQVVIAYLEEKGIPYKDFGCMDKSSVILVILSSISCFLLAMLLLTQ